MTTRVGWLDASSGISGDMLLGALTSIGALDIGDVVARLDVDATAHVTATTRAGLAATQVRIDTSAAQPHRRLPDVLNIVASARVAEPVIARATATFERLAAAEARVHGVDPSDVEFHEVGAVDAIVDVVAACAGLHALALDRLIVSPVALGSGSVHTRHGTLPVPAPAVVELLRGSRIEAYAGPVAHELATPTGVALAVEWADDCAAMPSMTVDTVGVGAGGREHPDRPNVLRLVVGAAADAAHDDHWQQLDCNVDDLDPRLWPVVIERLLAAGAADAWLTPIVMKKGRPAHTLSVLVAAKATDAVLDVVFRETSTIGIRTVAVGKRALDRDWTTVDVDGQPVRVKLARIDGVIVNVAPEFDDVMRAATAIDRPVKNVLAAAAAAAQAQLS